MIETGTLKWHFNSEPQGILGYSCHGSNMFLTTAWVHPQALRRGAPSRVVIVSSGAHENACEVGDQWVDLCYIC